MVSAVAICHRTALLQSYQPHSPCCTFHPRDSFILYLEVCSSSAPSCLTLPAPPLWQPPICSESLHPSLLCLVISIPQLQPSLTHHTEHHTLQVPPCQNGKISFLWLSNVCVYHLFCTHSPMVGRLGCLQILATVNNAAVNIAVVCILVN